MTPPTGDWLAEAIATRDIHRVRPSMAVAGARINDSRRHIGSARLLADRDTSLAIAACHDAIRKAVTAHMAAAGLRPRSGEGAHRIVLEYARHQLAHVIADEDLAEAEDIRRDRVLVEYGDPVPGQFDGNHVRAEADVAERIVNAVGSDLAAQAKKTPKKRS